MKSQSKTKSEVSREDVDQLVGRFLQDLERQEVSPKTRASYRLDLLHFADWFSQTAEEGFIPEAMCRGSRTLSSSDHQS